MWKIYPPTIPAGCTSPTKSQGNRMPAKKSMLKRHAVAVREPRRWQAMRWPLSGVQSGYHTIFPP